MFEDRLLSDGDGCPEPLAVDELFQNGEACFSSQDGFGSVVREVAKIGVREDCSGIVVVLMKWKSSFCLSSKR